MFLGLGPTNFAMDRRLTRLPGMYVKKKVLLFHLGSKHYTECRGGMPMRINKAVNLREGAQFGKEQEAGYD